MSPDFTQSKGSSESFSDRCNSSRHCVTHFGSKSIDGTLPVNCVKAERSGAKTALDKSKSNPSPGSPFAALTALVSSFTLAPYLGKYQHLPGNSSRPALPATCAASHTYKSRLCVPSNFLVSAKTTSSSGRLIPCPITSVQTRTSNLPARASSSCFRLASGGNLPKITDALAPALRAMPANDNTAARENATTATKRLSDFACCRKAGKSAMGSLSKCNRLRRCVRWTVTACSCFSKTRRSNGSDWTGPQMRTCLYLPDLAANNRRVQAWPRCGSAHQCASSNTKTLPCDGATSAVQHSTGASGSLDSSPVHNPTVGGCSPQTFLARASTLWRTSQANARNGPA
mmetsp:Transcript_26434/g.80182  ORF Transcript_26434/g.80182 Transcript_26434/m.80182 type:complete len:343 (-) Transcript_26434:556-1584(-)